MKRHHIHRIHRHFQLGLLALPIILLVGYLLFTFDRPKTQTGQKPMNVVLISIDSLRPDHMGTYGYARNTSPHIDAWAKDAVVFNKYFSTSYLTPISEVSVQTGKYPFTTGVVNFESPLASSTPTLAEILKKNGWQTASFGSSAEFSGYVAGYNLARGFDTYKLSQAGGDMFNGRGGNFVVQSLPWLKEAATKDKPFFLWIGLGSVHWPYGQGEQRHFSSSTYDGFFTGASTNTWRLVDYLFENKYYGRNVHGEKLKPIVQIGKEDVDYLIGRYDDGILMTDRRVGQLLDYLKESGLDKNTIVILESEHGEGFNERGYILHYDIYDEQVHTPLIIKAPKVAPRRIDALASGVDVLPTILSLLELPPTETDGASLLPVMTGTGNAPRDHVFLTHTALWERVMASMGYEGLDGFYDLDNKEHFADVAIRTADWKLIHRRSHEVMKKWKWHNIITNTFNDIPEYELYYLTNDPGERDNIYEREKGNPIIVDLQQQLSDWEQKQFKIKVPETKTEEVQPYF